MKKILSRILVSVVILTVVGIIPSAKVQAKNKTVYYYTNHWSEYYDYNAGEMNVTSKSATIYSYWGKGKNEYDACVQFDYGNAKSIKKKYKFAKNFKVTYYGRIEDGKTVEKKLPSGYYRATGPITVKVVNNKIKSITFMQWEW